MSTTKNPWIVLKNETVYESNWIKVEKNEVINPAGNDGIYSVVNFKNLAIGIIPLDENYHTWLVGQYRFPIESYSWEIPEGGGDPTVDPKDSAKRELKEETGIVASEMTEIMRLHLSNSATDELAIIFIAKGLSFESACPEETEILKLKKVSLQEAFDLCLSGKITDAMSIAGILKTYHLRKENLI